MTIAGTVIALACGSLALYALQERQNKLNHGLVEALRRARYKEARGLLDQGADPNVRLPDGAVTGRQAIVRLLTFSRQGQSRWELTEPPLLLCRPRIERSRHASILSEADENNRAKTLEALIRHGAQVDAVTTSGLTLLQTAATQADVTLVKILLSHGASQTPAGDTPPPLNMARGAPRTLLIEAGADPNALFLPSRPMIWLDHGLEEVVTPLSHAALDSDRRAVALLLERGATPHVCVSVRFPKPGLRPQLTFRTAPLLEVCMSRADLLDLFLRRYGPLDRPNENGLTLLEEVVAAPTPLSRKREMIALLTGHGADPAARDANGGSALSTASRLADDSGADLRKRAAAREYRALLLDLQRVAKER